MQKITRYFVLFLAFCVSISFRLLAQQEIVITEADGSGLSDGHSMFLLIGFIIALLMLLPVIIIFSRRRNGASNGVDAASGQLSRSEFDSLKQKVEMLAKRVAQLEEAQKRPVFQEQSAIEGTPVTSVSQTAEEPVEVPQEKAAEEPLRKVFYAIYPDLGQSFSQMQLKQQASSETVYRIEVENDHATFMLSEDPEAQAFALRNPSIILKGACQYENMPDTHRHIQTLSPGSLRKTPEGWLVTNRARISFTN